MTLTIKFGQPHYGWLPLEFVSGDFSLQCDISDVFGNSIDYLVSALISAAKGDTSEVILFLEPQAYCFSFMPLGEQKIKFCIKYSPDDCLDPSLWKPIFSITEQKDEILRPFLAALNEHFRHSYDKHDWPESDAFAIGELRTLLAVE